MANTFEVKGLREALETIRKLPDHIAPQGGGPINRALFKAARPWQEQAAANAAKLGPGNHARKGFSLVGRLKDNIIRRRDPDPESNGHYARVSVGYSSRIYWGSFVENGTEKQPAQPFLRPVLNQAGQEPINIFAEALKRDIKRITRKLAK